MTFNCVAGCRFMWPGWATLPCLTLEGSIHRAPRRPRMPGSVKPGRDPCYRPSHPALQPLGFSGSPSEPPMPQGARRGSWGDRGDPPTHQKAKWLRRPHLLHPSGVMERKLTAALGRERIRTASLTSASLTAPARGSHASLLSHAQIPSKAPESRCGGRQVDTPSTRVHGTPALCLRPRKWDPLFLP